MPISKAPYKRVYKSSKSRGQTSRVICDKCGARVPKWKTVPVRVTSGIGRIDKVVWQAMTHEARSAMKSLKTTMRVCPKCAKHYGFFKVGISKTKKGRSRGGSMRYGARRRRKR